MTGFNKVMAGIIANASQTKQDDGDYVQDGILYCGKCHTPKQCRVNICGIEKLVGCTCKCGSNAPLMKQHQETEERGRRLEIEQLRLTGIADKQIQKYSFDMAEDNKQVQIAWRYVNAFPRLKKDNVGLLFWGGVGGGKTFCAGCIANTLINNGVSVLVTSFPRILGAEYEERAGLMDAISRYSLVIIDDLGAERQSQYALETVCMAIDERYKSGKPLIVTTNLSLDEIKNPKNTEYARIYDRVIEMCMPIKFDDGSRRKKEASRKMEIARELLGG